MPWLDEELERHRLWYAAFGPNCRSCRLRGEWYHVDGFGFQCGDCLTAVLNGRVAEGPRFRPYREAQRAHLAKFFLGLDGCPEALAMIASCVDPLLGM